jgi:hypothetical protein
MRLADRFEHFNGRDAVKSPGDVAVILQAQVDFVRQPFALQSFAREFQLLLR